MNRRPASLSVEDLEVRRGASRLVEALSFTIAAGQRALIIGRNGTGKTSLLRILAGIAPVTAGRIALDGRPQSEWGQEERSQLAYRGHLAGLKLDLTIRENLRFWSELRGSGATYEAWLDELSLARVADRPVRQLSAGQRRRVGLAVLRAAGAALWFLDEPITNLDSEGRALVTTWLDQHTGAGGMAVIATHSPEQLAAPGAVVIEL